MSDRDQGPFSPPTPAKVSSPTPNSDSQLLSDIRDQAAVQKLIAQGMYKRAGLQNKSLWNIEDQIKLQTDYLRQIRNILMVGLFVLLVITLLIGIIYAYAV